VAGTNVGQRGVGVAVGDGVKVGLAVEVGVALGEAEDVGEGGTGVRVAVG
jgi:hypothetical protein